MCQLNTTLECWLVPSQSGEKIDKVDLMAQTCTCPDHAEAGHKCKHLYAVEFTIQREMLPDGTLIETKTLTFTEKKVYKQDWPKYNDAQQNEKKRFLTLLFDLTRGVPNPERDKGRLQQLVRALRRNAAWLRCLANIHSANWRQKVWLVG